LPVLKKLITEKTGPEKKLKANFSKKLKVPESSQYFSQKTKDLFHHQGPILIDFEAKIRFLRHILIKLNIIDYFGKMSWILGKN